MKKTLSLVLAIVLTVSCLSVAAFAAPAAPKNDTNYRNVMYYGDWSIYDCQDYFNPSDIDASLLTHLNFAFLDFDANCNLILCDDYADFEAQLPEHGKDELQYGAPYSGVFGAMRILREKNPNLKIGISIGGWTRCGDFSTVAANPAKRALLAKNLAKFIDYLGFDFLDVDWEYPGDVRPADPEGNGVAIDEGHPNGSPADRHNFTLLMQAFRKELDALGAKNGKHYELSAAMSANTNKMAMIEYDKVLDTVDFLNMMTYDLNGSWNNYTGHQTGLYTNPNFSKDTTPDGVFSVDASIQYLKKTYGNQIDYSKIVVGVSSYTRGWAGVKKGTGLDQKNPGLFAPAEANSVADEEKLKGGVFAFHDVPALKQKYGVEEYYDETAQAAYLYGPETGYFFTYDNERSVAAKGQYVRDNGLGGLICWMASQDRDHVLTRTMKESLIGDGQFPDHEIKVAVPDVKVSIRAAGKNNYVVTIKNLEQKVEHDKTLASAERFQKTVMNGKLYIETKSGAKFSAGEDGSDSGKIYNKNGVGIIDLASAYENQIIEAGRTVSFQVRTSGKADLADIVSITMTQRILPSMAEFGKTVVYGEGGVNPEPTVKPTEPKPTVKPTEPKPTVKPTEPKPTVKPTEPKPTVKPTEPKPTVKPTEPKPTVAPTEPKPTAAPTEPTVAPTEPNPTEPVKVEKWAPNVVYKQGDVVAFGDKFYSCRMAHTSLTNWEPVNVPALWQETENPGTNPVDPKPTDPTDPEPTEKPTDPKPGDTWDAGKVYNGGETVVYNGKKFQARWWTQGDKPDASQEWGVWKPV